MLDGVIQSGKLTWTFNSWVKKYHMICDPHNIKLRNNGQTLALLISPISFMLTSSLADHIGR
jgi:hypothetical protein